MNGNITKWVIPLIVGVFLAGMGYILNGLDRSVERQSKAIESLATEVRSYERVNQEKITLLRERMAQGETRVETLGDMVRQLCEDIRSNGRKFR